ncbi:uncharacterized protein LOC126672291 [Mercurialis annua]|uniref:uncharacterized protein LOC126672291 n=1 Tax=Mercurialis annua TaxID=3986 RepID=UPI00215F34DF|nr:uncharacterized protein LOC126672291 [Mercurialis annua]
MPKEELDDYEISRDRIIVSSDSSRASPVSGRICRICLLSSHESGSLIQLGCSCMNDLVTARPQCATTWFEIRGNRTCEICNFGVSNVVIRTHETDTNASNVVIRTYEAETSNVVTKATPFETEASYDVTEAALSETEASNGSCTISNPCRYSRPLSRLLLL